MSLPDFASPWVQLSAEELYVNWVFGTNQSLSVGDAPEFQAFLNKVGSFSPPTSNRLSSYWLQKKYSTHISKLKRSLKNVQHIAVTTQGWTGLKTSFWTINLSWIDSKMQMQSEILASIPVIQMSQEASDLYLILSTTIEQSGIDLSKIVCVTTDEGGAAPCLASLFKVPKINCMEHLYQTVFRNADHKTRQKHPLLNIMLRSFEFLSEDTSSHQSTSAVNQEVENTTQEKPPGKGLNNAKQYSIGRWKSGTASLKTLREAKDEIIAVAQSSSTVFGILMRHYKDFFWSYVDEDINIQKLFEDSARLLQPQNSPTLHLLIPVVLALKAALISKRNQYKPTEIIFDLCDELIKELTNKYEAWNEFELIAFALNPTYRSSRQTHMAAAWAAGAELVQKHLEACRKPSFPAKKAATARSRAKPARSTNDLNSFLTARTDNSRLEEESIIDTSEQSEWDLFLQFDFHCDDDSPGSFPILEFWRLLEPQCPELANLAKMVLCVPCSQTEPDPLFSQMSLLNTFYQNQMEPQVASKLITVGKTIQKDYQDTLTFKNSDTNQRSIESGDVSRAEASWTEWASAHGFSRDLDQEGFILEARKPLLETAEQGFTLPDDIGPRKSRKIAESSTPHS